MTSTLIAFWLGGVFVLFHVRWKCGGQFTAAAIAVGLTWPFFVLKDLMERRA